MKDYRRINELEKEAKELLGTKAAEIIASDLKIEKWNERTLTGCSPFTIDNNPSFSWNPKENCFKDFSSGKNYGIIDHYMEYLHMSRLEAVKTLLDIVGIKSDTEILGDIKKYKSIICAVDEPESNRSIVEEYMKKRGISPSTLDFCNVKQSTNGMCAFQFFDEDGKLVSTKYRISHSPKKGELKWYWQKDITVHDILYGIDKIDVSKPLLIVEGLCFPYDAEVLTPKGWMKLGEYDGSPVMQVNENFSCKFVRPEAYVVNNYDGIMYRVERGGNYLSDTTENHKIVYVTDKGKIIKRPVKDMPKSIIGNIKTTANYNGKGINLSDDELRLFVAYSADGSNYKNKKNRIRFQFAKKRKFLRLVEILNRLNIEFTYSINTSEKYSTGVKYYVGFTDTKEYLTKKFNMEWIPYLSSKQIKVILDEVVFWDGYKFNMRNMGEYYTIIKNNADFIQTLCHISGFMSTIKKRYSITSDSKQRKLVYSVSMLYGKSGVSWQNMHKNTTRYNYKGKVYCVKVPSGMILVRQEDKITVSSNCDRLAVVEAGFYNVVSIPNGAEGDKWIDYNYDILSQVEEIILWFDNDNAGKNGLEKVANRLGEYRVKIVETDKTIEDKVEEFYLPYGHTIRKTDANNVLVACGKDILLGIIESAKAIDNPRVRKLMEFAELEVDDIPHTSTGIVEMDKIFSGIYENSLTLITGKAGDGKSNIINTMFIISPLENHEKVFLYSGELPTRILLGNMMPSFASRRHLVRYENPNGRDGFKTTTQASEIIHKFYMDGLYVYSEDSILETDSLSLYDNIVYAYKRHGCTNFIIDNLLSLDCSKEEGENYYDKEAAFCRKLKVFTRKHPVKVCLIIHTRKTQVGAKYIEGDDIQGSSTHIKICDRAFSIERLDKEDEDGNSVRIRCIKDRQKGLKGRFVKLKFDIASRRLFSTPEERDRKLSWEEGIEIPYPTWVTERLVCNIPQYQDNYCEIF